MEELRRCFEKIEFDKVERLVISKPFSKSEEYKKIVIERKKDYWQIAKYTEKQVFHENISKEDLKESCFRMLTGHFLQMNCWTNAYEYIVLISKKGKCSFKRNALKEAVILKSPEHNRKKNYILEEGKIIEPLVDMGIFTKEGKVVKSMYDKYRQINRFVEIIDDSVKDFVEETINVIDFGCGKSYLTFVLYYYLTVVRGKKANIIGLDLKEDVIRKCNEAAKKYGYDGLTFELGNINGFEAPFKVDMVVTLHACDTATDYALYNAICWKAGMIFSVPCCQHELNGQMKPKNLGILSEYGIIKERFAALATDAVRGKLLEYSGYKTQLLEFIDFEHTPKNILIRATRKNSLNPHTRKAALEDVEVIMEEFGFEPTLYNLIMDK